MRALQDAIEALRASAEPSAAIIGGVMVELLARERGLSMARTTKDVDLGVPVLALRRDALVDELFARHYVVVEGHMFQRQNDVPSGTLKIDVLVPSHVTKQSQPRAIGRVTTISVGMLAEALEAVDTKEVDLVQTSGHRVRVGVPVPTPLGALALKLSAWSARSENKDATDVWRCLEICAHDGLQETDWKGRENLRTGVEGVWAASFSKIGGDGVVAATEYASLSGPEAERRAARIVLLGRRLFRST